MTWTEDMLQRVQGGYQSLNRCYVRLTNPDNPACRTPVARRLAVGTFARFLRAENALYYLWRRHGLVPPATGWEAAGSARCPGCGLGVVLVEHLVIPIGRRPGCGVCVRDPDPEVEWTEHDLGEEG